MTEHWRGNPDEASGMSRFFRRRWEYGSVYVLDIDRVICNPDATKGMLVEESERQILERMIAGER